MAFDAAAITTCMPITADQIGPAFLMKIQNAYISTHAAKVHKSQRLYYKGCPSQ
jgi:hypothetical protein